MSLDEYSIKNVSLSKIWILDTGDQMEGEINKFDICFLLIRPLDSA